MSDAPDDFRRKAMAMFAKVDEQVDQIARTWVMQFVVDVVSNTPGPGNQDPPNTPYIATGRLRAGWHLGEDAELVSSKWDGGPYDETDNGSETVQGISSQLFSMKLPPTLYLENDVAYGEIVHEGLGRHHSPRPWVRVYAANPSRVTRYLDQARQSVMSRG